MVARGLPVAPGGLPLLLGAGGPPSVAGSRIVAFSPFPTFGAIPPVPSLMPLSPGLWDCWIVPPMPPLAAFASFGVATLMPSLAPVTDLFPFAILISPGV